jgi:hypothetical protein
MGFSNLRTNNNIEDGLHPIENVRSYPLAGEYVAIQYL